MQLHNVIRRPNAAEENSLESILNNEAGFRHLNRKMQARTCYGVNSTSFTFHEPYLVKLAFKH